MNRLLLIAAFATCLLACGESADKGESRNADLPNIILLVGDDQGYPYFGFMGADYVQTPNMDVLAASGTLFPNGYVPSNHCRPSLQTLMTGTLPSEYEREVSRMISENAEYQALPEEEKAAWAGEFRFHAMKHFETLPRLLAPLGYNSFQGGKWWEYNYQNGGFSHGMTTGWDPTKPKNSG